MSLAVLVLGLVVMVAASHPLPFAKVEGWDETRVDKLLTSLENTNGWWVRVADRVYSPMLEGSTVPSDHKIENYYVVLGQLPSDLEKDVVGHDERFGGVSIVHSRHGAPTSRSPHSSRAIAVHNKLRLFVDIRGEGRTERSLERSLEEDRELQSAMDAITDESYMQEIVKITSTGSGAKEQRNVQTGGHTTAEKYIGCRMKTANLHVQYVPFDARGNPGMDIVGCAPGHDSKFMILGAHYDTLPVPPKKSPGAMDNGSGVGVVMSAMDAMAGQAFQHSVCYTAFDGEELGLLGSHRLANEISANAKLKANFLGAVTSDMSTGFKKDATANRDYGWNSHNSIILRKDPQHASRDGIHIDGDSGSKALIKLFGDSAKEVVADQHMPIMESTASVWNSDQKSFHSAGLPAIDICAANHRAYQYWHHDHNTTDVIDPVIGTQIARTTVAATFSLAGRMGERDMEESPDQATVPHFKGAKSFEQVFGDVDCNAVLDKHDKHLAAKKAEGHKAASTHTAHKATHDADDADEEAPRSHVAHKHSHNVEHKAATHTKIHTHMSKDLARHLEETLDSLEKEIGQLADH